MGYAMGLKLKTPLRKRIPQETQAARLRGSMPSASSVCPLIYATAQDNTSAEEAR
jgi:hypothetical protein